MARARHSDRNPVTFVAKVLEEGMDPDRLRSRVNGVTFTSNGDLFITDWSRGMVRKVSASTGIINLVLR